MGNGPLHHPPNRIPWFLRPHMVSSTGSSAAPPSKPSGSGGEGIAAHLPQPALWSPCSGRITGDSGVGLLVGAGDVEGCNPGGVDMVVASPIRPFSVDDGCEEDAALRKAGVLTLEEVLRRRLRRVRRLGRYYRRQYWGLIEAVRVRYREYYWNFGRSAVEGDERVRGAEEESAFDAGVVTAGSREIGRGGLEVGGGEVGGIRKKDKDRCVFGGCKAKPMALSRYCHLHILSDQKQKLYKACTYPSKRSFP
ncbi:hypothetical protein Taro_013267 [Colocasia esculenta]|uniref:KAT8 regulatory NSL complex subunit 2 n=1 Tax=Colocasia esculenta TaxID=4460 RepID=A0A843UBD4_COLES|nr:hypothetical protein [Colocasia esculenta]